MFWFLIFLMFWLPSIGHAADCAQLPANSLSRQECERTAKIIQAPAPAPVVIQIEEVQDRGCGADPGVATWATRQVREEWLTCLEILAKRQAQPAPGAPSASRISPPSARPVIDQAAIESQQRDAEWEAFKSQRRAQTRSENEQRRMRMR